MYRHVLSLFLIVVAANAANAQYYYVQPTYFQPQVQHTIQPIWMPNSAQAMAFESPVSDEIQAANVVTHEGPQFSAKTNRATQYADQAHQVDESVRPHAKQVSLQLADDHESIAQYEPLVAGNSTAAIPDCPNARHILDFPGILAQIDCCPDNTTGSCDRDIHRFYDPEEARRYCHDPKCVICVQEPFICEKVCYEEQEVVFFRCYQKCEPFSCSRCEDQRCIQEYGQRTVKKLDPCKAKIKIPVKKVVRRCPACS